MNESLENPFTSGTSDRYSWPLLLLLAPFAAWWLGACCLIYYFAEFPSDGSPAIELDLLLTGILLVGPVSVWFTLWLTKALSRWAAHEQLRPRELTPREAHARREAAVLLPAGLALAGLSVLAALFGPRFVDEDSSLLCTPLFIASGVVLAWGLLKARFWLWALVLRSPSLPRRFFTPSFDSRPLRFAAILSLFMAGWNWADHLLFLSKGVTWGHAACTLIAIYYVNLSLTHSTRRRQWTALAVLAALITSLVVFYYVDFLAAWLTCAGLVAYFCFAAFWSESVARLCGWTSRKARGLLLALAWSVPAALLVIVAGSLVLVTLRYGRQPIPWRCYAWPGAGLIPLILFVVVTWRARCAAKELLRG